MFGGVGIGVVVLLILVLVLTMRRAERGLLRVPVLMVVFHLLVMVARAFVPEESEPDELLRVVGVFFLSMAAARCGYLLLLRLVVNRVIGGDVPRILRDLIQALLFAAAMLVTLHVAGVEPGALFTTSALLTAVVGFALQDTLGNLFAGLAIQAQQPFRVGDWIQWDDGDDRTGRVVEMNWRAVKVVTLEHVEMTVPNSTLAKSALRNFSAPTKDARRKVYIYAPTTISPTQIKKTLLSAIEEVDGVLLTPQTSVLVHEFTERGVEYEVRYFIREFDRRDTIAGEVRMRLWYALDRLGVEIPAPMRTVRLHEVTEETLEHEKEAQVDSREDALRHVDFLDALPTEALHQLAEQTARRLFAPGEPIIREGDHGDELFIVLRGQVRVHLGSGKRRREVSRLGPGQFFGEMSLMTGAMRTASVSAATEVDLMVIGKRAFQPVLETAPELAETISSVLTERSAELMSNDEGKSSHGNLPAPSSGVLLGRIKKFFSLTSDSGDPENEK